MGLRPGSDEIHTHNCVEEGLHLPPGIKNTLLLHSIFVLTWFYWSQIIKYNNLSLDLCKRPGSDLPVIRSALPLVANSLPRGSAKASYQSPRCNIARDKVGLTAGRQGIVKHLGSFSKQQAANTLKSSLS